MHVRAREVADTDVFMEITGCMCGGATTVVASSMHAAYSGSGDVNLGATGARGASLSLPGSVLFR